MVIRSFTVFFLSGFRSLRGDPDSDQTFQGRQMQKYGQRHLMSFGIHNV